MNLINDYIVKSTSNIQTAAPKKVQSFAESIKNDNTLGIDYISNVTPDYNVSAPMPYSFVEDIKLSDDITAKCYKLANGQKVIIAPKEGTTVVKTYVNTGSLNEPDNVRGISHYIEHNLFNGSEALGDKVFFDEVNKMGAKTNASTSFSITDYFISSNLLDDNDLESKIKLHAGMIQTPKFMLDKLEKEKKIVNQEINLCLSNDENIAFTETLKNLFNIKSSSLDLVAGNTDNITALTREDVIEYFNHNYYPANMTTVITGEVNPEETMALVSKYFTSKKVPSQTRHYEKMVPTETAVRRDIVSQKSTGGASVFLGFVGPENANYKDSIYLDALEILMSDLANSKMSPLERKYATGIIPIFERLGTRPDDKSMILISSEVKEDYVEPFLKELYLNIQKLSQPMTEDELKAVKNKMKKYYQTTLENSHMLNWKIGKEFLNSSTDSLKTYLETIDNMTAQDIANIAKKYLDLNKVSMTVVHPSGTEIESINKNYNTAKNISFSGLNKKAPIDTSKIIEYRMPNNFSVLMNDSKSDNVEYRFNLFKKEWTPKQAAIADILNYMFRYGGTEKATLTEISKCLDKNGIGINFSINDYGIYMTGDFPAENTKKALELFRDKILTPEMSEECFKQAVQICKDIYLTSEVSAFDKYNKVIYKGLPYESTADDKLKSLSNITLQDVKDFYNDIFKNSQGQVFVSAPFSKHPDLKQVIFDDISKFANVKPKDTTIPETFKPIDKAQVHTVEYKKNSAQIIEGFKFKYPGNVKDAVCLSILEEILGGSSSSRLFMDLRETRHLAYSVEANFEPIDNIGVMNLMIRTTTENQETGEQSFDNIKKSIDGFNENIQKISTEKVTPEELERAKRTLKDSMLSAFEMTSSKTSVLDTCAKNPYGVDYVNQKLALIDSITAEDILNTAKYVFKSKPVYSIAATKASLDANKEFLDSLVANS